MRRRRVAAAGCGAWTPAGPRAAWVTDPPCSHRSTRSASRCASPKTSAGSPRRSSSCRASPDHARPARGDPRHARRPCRGPRPHPQPRREHVDPAAQVERLRGDIGDLGEEITGMRADLSDMPDEVEGLRAASRACRTRSRTRRPPHCRPSSRMRATSRHARADLLMQRELDGSPTCSPTSAGCSRTRVTDPAARRGHGARGARRHQPSAEARRAARPLDGMRTDLSGLPSRFQGLGGQQRAGSTASTPTNCNYSPQGKLYEFAACRFTER